MTRPAARGGGAAAQAALLGGLVEADADELDPVVAVLGVEFLHLGHLADARPAPRGPEIDHDDLPFELLDRDRGAGDRVGESQVERLADPFPRLAGPAELGRVGRVRVILDEPLLQRRLDRGGAGVVDRRLEQGSLRSKLPFQDS